MTSKEFQKIELGNLYRFAELGRMSGGLFHDLTNHLTAVTLAIRKLEKLPSPLFLHIKKRVEKAVETSRSMENFIRGIKKQMSGQNNRCLLILNEEIQESLAILQYKAKEFGVSFVFEQKYRIEMYGNASKLQQLISNLVSNAIDAYRGINRKKKTVKIILNRVRDVVILTIQDNGCGIEEKIIPLIFNPFFSTKSKNEIGMGLGLSTTKDIIANDFNGNIEVVSKKGNGSTFRVSFPLDIRKTSA
jgi:signal transduction histidine kinase